MRRLVLIALFLLVLGTAVTGPATATHTKPQPDATCTDRQDNDGDGRTDRQDRECHKGDGCEDGFEGGCVISDPCPFGGGPVSGPLKQLADDLRADGQEDLADLVDEVNCTIVEGVLGLSALRIGV